MAGVLLFARLARWQGYRTFGEPIVLVLHLGYLWLAIALALIGLGALLPSIVPTSSGIHALTAGAVGTMTLAVMTRASRGHTGRPTVANGATIAIYFLVTLGAICRVAAPLLRDSDLSVLVAGSIAWSAAFLLFALAYGPMLVTKRLAG